MNIPMHPTDAIIAWNVSRYKRAKGLYAVNAKYNQDDTNAIDELNEINEGVRQRQSRSGIGGGKRTTASAAEVPRTRLKRRARKSTWFKFPTVGNLNQDDLQ